MLLDASSDVLALNPLGAALFGDLGRGSPRSA